MPIIGGEQWRAENANRRYPFDDRALLASGTAAEIPLDLLIDGRLWVLPAGTNSLYLSAIERTATSLVFTIAQVADAQPVATGTLADASTDDIVYLVDDYERPAGLFVVGPGLAGMRERAAEVLAYEPEDTLFATAVHTPVFADPGVVGFLLPDGTVVAGDVWFVGERGVELWEREGRIRIDIVGDPTGPLQDCYDVNETLANERAFAQPVRSINGVPADEYGDLQILVGSQLVDAQVLRIVLAPGQITIKGAV